MMSRQLLKSISSKMKTLTKALGATSFFLLLLIIPVKNNAGDYSPKKATGAVVNAVDNKTAADNKAFALYDVLKLKSFGLTKAAFNYAYKGYLYLQQKGMLAR